MRCKATQCNTMQRSAKQSKDPDEPEEPQELREPRDGEPKERSRGTWAGGRKCHRVSASKEGRKERRRMRREEARSGDTGGKMDERRLKQGGRREHEWKKGNEAGWIA